MYVCITIYRSQFDLNFELQEYALGVGIVAHLATTGVGDT